jgi:hypothetical protein
MSWWGVAKTSLLCALVWICFLTCAAAREYHGAVTFGGLPVPGATVTATAGANTFSTVTDLGGLYHFDDLPDGAWTINVEMQCFVTISAQVTVGDETPAGKWELMLLSVDQLMARTKLAQNPMIAQPKQSAPPQKKLDGSTQPNAPAELPKPPESENEQSADGYLVNGSVNNAATSRYATNPAFGNTRSGSKALYTGGFATILDNSVTDARPYAISGLEAPKSEYDLITNTVYIGGPVRIPHLLRRGPTFFVNYQWTRNNNAAIDTGLVPTLDERAGNLAGLLNAQGQPVKLFDPVTGLPYNNNQVPVSPQAAALLSLYPAPNPNIPSASGYNYQAPVINSTHQDSLQSRLDKTIGRRDQLYGGFDFQSTRADTVNLFGFVDAVGSLGMNANIHWTHRVNPHLFVFTSYTFSRFRTEVTPNFANRENISGPNHANIAGNDQDPADWGPPALDFTSGIAALSDANSAFNRNRTDGVAASVGFYRGRHNISAGGDFRKQQWNDFFEQNPRGTFGFTGAATAGTGAGAGSDLADLLIGVPDTSAIAYGNADKYFREPVYDAYFTDDWRILPVLTINAGLRWEYSAPMSELHGRLVNLDLTSRFTQGAPVLGTDPLGPVTGQHYPASLMRPDLRGIEPRIAISWRPIPASTVVVRAGYGIYRDSSVYQSIVTELAQQAPLSKSFTVENGSACPLTLANGFGCASVDTFAVDPNYRIGYAQIWQASMQRDLPAALQIVATYSGVKGTHGAQEFLPNSYPIGATDSCPGCPSGFVYRASGGNSIREAGEVQLRRRLRNGFTASLDYTYSKSIDDDAMLGGQGYVTASVQSQNAALASTAGPSASIAQNWLDPRAERALSTFDQRQLLKLTAQYTSGEGLHGGTLMHGWRGRLLKEWTVLGMLSAGTGRPETPIYPNAVPGTGFSSVIRPSLTGAPIYSSATGTHLNASAYEEPSPGAWGTAARDSITGPGEFTLNSSLARTFRPHGRLYLDLTVNATNLLNHPDFTGWDAIWNDASLSNSQQFGRPLSANAMRALETTIRLRF